MTFFGIRCKCDQLVHVSGIEQEEPITLEEKQRMLRQENWEKIVAHISPSGCGRSTWCTADDLIILPPRQVLQNATSRL
jgi:hypothetical protein